MPETYYDRLGVASDASTETIRQAYRERLKAAHPDVSDDPDAADRTRRLVEAKEVLTDDAERRRYDRLGHDEYVAVHGHGSEADQEENTDPSPGDGTSRDRESADRDSTSSGGTSRTGAAAGNRRGGVDAGSDGGTTRSAAGHAAGSSTQRTDRNEGGPGRARSSGRTDREQRRRRNRETRAGWNTAGKDAGDSETTYARGWRAWDTDAPYRVHATDRTTVGNRLYPPGPSLILLAVGFAVYPLMLWAATTPAFPLAINLVVAACLLGLVAFLVGMPGVGIVVFGAWSLLLPAALTFGFGIPPLSLPWLVGLAGTTMPFGLSVLIYVALRA